MRPPHRVVVVGGGFGGLTATRTLANAPVEVTLIDRDGLHVFQPLLYQVATGILSEGEVARPLRELLRRQRNASLLLGEVHDVDLTQSTVTSTAHGRDTVTSYDTLVVAAGATHSYFGNEGFEAHAPGLKSVPDALALRAQIFDAFERAEQATDPGERAAHLTFVVIGGGPTGIEMAGQVAELSRRSLRGNFRSIDPATTRVVLVEAASTLLANFGPSLSTRAQRSLEKVGVEVLVDARVVGVDAAGIRYRTGEETRTIPSTTKIWAAGVAASPLAGLLGPAAGAAANRSGQLTVGPDCTLPGHPEVFVVGDMMSIPGAPGVAQLAIQSGRYAARTVRARLAGRATKGFRYRDKGSLATIARFRAVARIGRVHLSGLVAWLLWLGVHLVTLNGYRNRVFVTLHWGVSFVCRGRAERASPTPTDIRCQRSVRSGAQHSL